MATKLGRGLSALIPDYNTITDSISDLSSIRDLPLTLIKRNPYQNRQCFSDVTIQELASSIQFNGLVQPIVVRSLGDNEYEIISGERRFKAVKSLGYKTIPAIVKSTVSDKDTMVMSLLENIQREDINPLELAIAYSNIMKHQQLTQQSLSKLVGKSRSSVANTLRLLDLSDLAKEALMSGHITEGHARVLLHFKDHSQQDDLVRQLMEKKLTVRETECLISETSKHSAKSRRSQPIPDSRFKATYSSNGQKGKVVIHFNSQSEFEAIRQFLTHA